MSPVNDLYGKIGLAQSHHRISMCQLAAANSPIIMVDEWEAQQPAYQRTLTVLHRILDTLEDFFEEKGGIPGAPLVKTDGDQVWSWWRDVC